MVFPLTVTTFHYDRSTSEGPPIYTASIKLTNKTFGLLKKAPSTYLKRLARHIVKVAQAHLPQRDNPDVPATYGVCITLTHPNGKPRQFWPPSKSIHAQGQNYHLTVAKIIRFLYGTLLEFYQVYFHHTATNRPYTYKRKGETIYRNYGGKGTIRVIPKEQHIVYDYTRLDAYKPNALVYRMMNQNPHWTHELHLRRIKHPNVVHQHLDNLKIAAKLTGGTVWVGTILPQPAPDPNSPLPF